MVGISVGYEHRHMCLCVIIIITVLIEIIVIFLLLHHHHHHRPYHHNHEDHHHDDCTQPPLFPREISVGGRLLLRGIQQVRMLNIFLFIAKKNSFCSFLQSLTNLGRESGPSGQELPTRSVPGSSLWSKHIKKYKILEV